MTAASDTKTLSILVPLARRQRLPSMAIRVTAGPDRGVALHVAKRTALVGRAESADVRLSDKTASQFHAELEVCPEGVDVTDLGSRNGTRFGGAVIRQARLPFGSVLSVGSSKIEVAADAAFVAERSNATSFGDLVGLSQPMRETFLQLERLAATDLFVLLEGETGTGKELAARGLHARSRRASAPLVTVDCTTIPPSLAESALFGHEKGAFTGAIDHRTGPLEEANGGTLFFDEIGELPLTLQPKLLRVLERREVVPVGSTRPRRIDVRVVCATWRNLRAMVNAGTFRDDLYFRLAQARVRIPPLAERPDDTKPLIQHVLAALPHDIRAARGIAPDALEALAARPFPGNVRELRSVVERLAMLAETAQITLEDIAVDRLLAGGRAPRVKRAAAPSGPLEAFKEAKRGVVDAFERTYLQQVLTLAGTNISRAAALAGIERQTIRDLLKKHGLGSPR